MHKHEAECKSLEENWIGVIGIFIHNKLRVIDELKVFQNFCVDNSNKIAFN